jgi:hypothetical protein
MSAEEWKQLWKDSVMHNDYEGMKQAFDGLVAENKRLRARAHHKKLEAIREENNQLREAEKWEKIWWFVEDDEMPITPERIGMWLNFANEHYPDYDNKEDLEKDFAETLEWESDGLEAEQKLEAIRELCQNLEYDDPIILKMKIREVLGDE